jgi:hypothetical protein
MSLTINAARADDAEDVGIVFAVGAEHNGLHLDFVVPTLGEERTDRAIGEAAGEDFLFGRTAFALEVTAGELSGSGGLLAVIDGEREEILTFLGLGRGHGGHDDDSFAELNGYGAVGLLGELAGFNVPAPTGRVAVLAASLITAPATVV